MTTERIKELETQVSELNKANARLKRSLDGMDDQIGSLKADISDLLDEAESIDCGSAQLNRTAFTCRWHQTCLICERDELRAELEKLRELGVCAA